MAASGKNRNQQGALDPSNQVSPLPLRLIPDSALKLRTREVEEFDARLGLLAAHMAASMALHGGVGISANQVGFATRLCLISSADGVFALANPVVEWASEETAEIEEGCLSIPAVYVPVVRPEKVSVKAQDTEGNEHWFDLSGAAARVAQHEIDHLNGITMLDRTDRGSRWQALKALMARESAGLGMLDGQVEGFTEVPLATFTPSSAPKSEIWTPEMEL